MLTSALAAYSALAVVISFPLVLNLSSHLPKDLGDPLIAASLLWWNASVPPLTERWWDGLGFFPAHGMMAFSAHFLGASLIAAPLQWMGLNAIAAYNVTFLASFPLSAMAAHAVALTLTKRHDAALICGLAFGFNPFRVAHVEHLELLLAFGMPMALTALHRYVESRQRRWLAVLAGALVLQALSSSYYALFFTVFFGLWIVWFMRPRAWREGLAVCAAGASATLVVWPVVAGYSGVHATYNWRRDLSEEILKFSADFSSFVTASPLSALWGWTAPLNGAERQLFPGLTITALAIAGLVWSIRGSSGVVRDRWVIVSRILFAFAAVFVAIALAAIRFGPWEIEQGWLQVSVTTPYKPLSIGAALAVLGALSTATLRAAFHKRDPLVFYLVAASVLFMCSLGPQPTLLGERVLYEPPYAWLMRLPFFADSVRVPARFAMLGILALSVAASLAFHRLSRSETRTAALTVVVIGILLDGWMRALPLAGVPQSVYTIPQRERPSAVLELPLGDVWRDTAAIYRSTRHGVRAVNGYNGFEPIYYQVLRRGLADRDPTILDALASSGPILIAADNAADAEGRTTAFLAAHPRLIRLRDDGTWTLYWLPGEAQPRWEPRCAEGSIAIAAASDGQGAIPLEMLTDQDPATRWIVSPDEGEDDVVLDLRTVHHPCSVELSMGAAGVYYPGSLEVFTSSDAVTWEPAFTGRMAGPALRAVLEDPRDSRVMVPLHGRPARFIRLRADQVSAVEPWAIADIVLR
jgi:hypothetical protein